MGVELGPLGGAEGGEVAGGHAEEVDGRGEIFVAGEFGALLEVVGAGGGQAGARVVEDKVAAELVREVLEVLGVGPVGLIFAERCVKVLADELGKDGTHLAPEDVDVGLAKGRHDETGGDDVGVGVEESDVAIDAIALALAELLAKGFHGVVVGDLPELCKGLRAGLAHVFFEETGPLDHGFVGGKVDAGGLAGEVLVGLVGIFDAGIGVEFHALAVLAARTAEIPGQVAVFAADHAGIIRPVVVDTKRDHVGLLVDHIVRGRAIGSHNFSRVRHGRVKIALAFHLGPVVRLDAIEGRQGASAFVGRETRHAGDEPGTANDQLHLPTFF